MEQLQRWRPSALSMLQEMKLQRAMCCSLGCDNARTVNINVIVTWAGQDEHGRPASLSRVHVFSLTAQEHANVLASGATLEQLIREVNQPGGRLRARCRGC